MRVGIDNQINYSVTWYGPTMDTSHYDLREITVLDSKGQKIAKERLPEILKEEILALTYSGRKEPDPLHFRVIKDGILVFVLPQRNPTAVPLLPPPPVNPPQREQLKQTSQLQG
jgi:hypothetical protein